MPYAIQTHHLTKAYNSFKAVDDLEIAVERGEIFCTILKPSSGTATVSGFDLVREANKVRRSIGIVFQDPSIDDRLTARENLYMHANLYGVAASEQRERVDRILKLVELEDRADDLLRTYSVVCVEAGLGRGLLHYPKILFWMADCGFGVATRDPHLVH